MYYTLTLIYLELPMIPHHLPNLTPGRCHITDEIVPAGAGRKVPYGRHLYLLGPKALAACRFSQKALSSSPHIERKLLAAYATWQDQDNSSDLLDLDDIFLLAAAGIIDLIGNSF